MLDFLLPSGLTDGVPPYWYAVVSGQGSTRVVILEPGGQSDAFVSRYDSGLEYVTDAWYPTREQAIDDIATEFGEDLGTWQPVPEGESDAERFVLTTVAKCQ